jgi:hypothetical protein
MNIEIIEKVVSIGSGIVSIIAAFVSWLKAEEAKKAVIEIGNLKIEVQNKIESLKINSSSNNKSNTIGNSSSGNKQSIQG